MTLQSVSTAGGYLAKLFWFWKVLTKSLLRRNFWNFQQDPYWKSSVQQKNVSPKSLGLPYCGAWWRIFRDDAIPPEGRGFESRSSRQVRQVLHLQVPVALRRVQSNTVSTAVVGSASERLMLWEALHQITSSDEQLFRPCQYNALLTHHILYSLWNKEFKIQCNHSIIPRVNHTEPIVSIKRDVQSVGLSIYGMKLRGFISLEWIGLRWPTQLTIYDLPA